ncbi:hypothetical protein FQA39_LY18603 [Lamprigera yunnana]|nr:hypothetical protein FQA39_LY18603 [Lamprigera yunnana]
MSETKPTDTTGLDPENSSGVQQFTKTMFKLFTKLGIQPQKQVELPTFGGDRLENPKVFLSDLRRHFEINGVSEDQHLAVVTGQLRDKAATWWSGYQDFDLSFNDFVEWFLEKYDSPQVTAQMRAEFYGREQKSNETVRGFLQRKAQIAKRLEIPTKENVGTFVELLAPQLRLHFRRLVPITLEELLRSAERIEEDLKASGYTKSRRSLLCPKSNDPKCANCEGPRSAYVPTCPKRQEAPQTPSEVSPPKPLLPNPDSDNESNESHPEVERFLRGLWNKIMKCSGPNADTADQAEPTNDTITEIHKDGKAGNGTYLLKAVKNDPSDHSNQIDPSQIYGELEVIYRLATLEDP